MRKILTICMIILTLGLCGCSAQPESTAPDVTTQEQALPEGSFYVDFSKGKPATGATVADGWTNGSMFNVTWRKENAVFEDEKLRLVIDNDKKAGAIPYSGGEFRSDNFYCYGRYEVSMKPIKHDGVVSSFFTYTGPSDNNPWDEIDIEFLGKDTTIIQFNYFTNGVGEHEFVYELGFDASEDFHTYAFEWHKDKIVWFVDGKEVHTATEEIPSVPGKIMMNAWCGIGVDEWLKPFDSTGLPVTAEYEWIRFIPFE